MPMIKQLLLAYFSFLVLASANCPTPKSKKSKRQTIKEFMKHQMSQAFNAMQQQEAAEMAAHYARKTSTIHT